MTAWIMFRMFVLAITRAPSSFRANSDTRVSAGSCCSGCARSDRLLGVRRQRRMSNPSPAPAFDLRAFINRGAGLPPPQEPPASIPIDLGNNVRDPFADWPAQVGPLAIQYAAPPGSDVEIVGESKKEKKKEGKETKNKTKGTKRKAGDDDGDEEWTASQDGQSQPVKKKQKKQQKPKTRKTAPTASRVAKEEEKDYKEALDLLELEYDELEDELDQATNTIQAREAELKEMEDKLLEATTAVCPILCTERNSFNKSVMFSACGHTTCIDCFKVSRCILSL
jgi:hypothetical protein